MVVALWIGDSGDGETVRPALSVDDACTRPASGLCAVRDSERDGIQLLVRLASAQSQVAEVDAGLPTPTPTPSSVPSPLAAPLPPAEVEVADNVVGIICSFDWPQGCTYWVAVADCESGLHPSASGYGGSYVGLFQVWLGHGYGADWLTEPHNNVLAAWELSHGGVNTYHWPYCRYQ